MIDRFRFKYKTTEILRSVGFLVFPGDNMVLEDLEVGFWDTIGIALEGELLSGAEKYSPQNVNTVTRENSTRWANSTRFF